MPQILLVMQRSFIGLPRKGVVMSNDELFNVNGEQIAPLTGRRKRIELVAITKCGKKNLCPVWVPNQVFTDDNGQVYLLANLKTEKTVARRAKKLSFGYIIVRNKVEAEAWVGGEKVDFPSHLTNELGVRYMFVDFKAYGEVCKRVNGYCEAVKVEPVLVDTSVKEGARVESIVFGVREHDTILKKGMVLVQNKYHGETYQMKIEKLQGNYELVSTGAEGVQEWRPKLVVQNWTWTQENIFGVLWESFEFLAGAMININDPEDVYGCNYVVFNGNDVAPGSHRVKAVYVPSKPILKRWINEGALQRPASVLEDIPKTKYVEVVKPLELLAC